MPLSGFHPIIQKWFTERFGEPTEPQRLGWPEIRSGRDTLIAAPTGSGKTLTAFLSAIDSLFREGQPFGLPDETRVVYVSPLKALSNDIHRNLQAPLAEIEALALREGVFTAPIRVAVRTGDTPAAARQAMLRRPPHILVTTPESLYLLLTGQKSREILQTVTAVIVDEIHAVARDKRGSHLALSLERLDAVCAERPQRIGLSATQKPMEAVARFLTGTARVRDDRPDCAIVDVGHDRTLDLAIEDPPGELSAVCSNEQWDAVYARLSELVAGHRSTLIFVNTRRFAERITHHLTERLGPEAVSSHHGSLSKKIRLDAEQRLKAGALKAVVATASLELGIDIGFVDLVIQIGSPRSIATFLQRVGRSGHSLGLVPKGRLFALTRDELIECAALIRSVRAGLLDRIEIPEAPLDILAQQIVAEVAAGERDPGELYELCRGAWPFRNLDRKTYDRVVEMLAEGFATGTGRAGAYLHHDRVGGKLRARRGARLSALTSGGAIPELADYKVVAYPDQVTVGSVDEDFAIESMSGDIFLLGNTSWRILHVRGGEVAVSDAQGAPPTIPFWRGEAPGRTVELSRAVSDLREELAVRIDRPDDAAAWLVIEAAVPDAVAHQIVHYLAAQKAAAGMLPTQDHLLFERFFDESGGMQLVIHSPYGSRINRAWGLALRKSFCRTFDFELQASADDDGIVISLGPQQSFPLETIPKMVPSEKARAVLEQALLAAPMFMTRWRWNANRALAVLRSRGGKRVPPPLQRMGADDLLVKAFPQQMACRENLPQGDIPIPDHPLVFQTVYDCLHEAMDLDRWLGLLHSIEDGRVRITALDSREPTPFSYEILNANPYAFLDDAPLEERRARAVATRRTLTVESVRDIGRLDPHAIEQVRREAWPVVRDTDELHDALSVMGMLPEAEGRDWVNDFHALVSAGRATRAVAPSGTSFWIATEQWPMALAARPDLSAEPAPRIPEGVRSDWAASEAWTALVRGRIEVAGPITAEKLSADLGLEVHCVESALGALEAQGIVLRGRFTPPPDDRTSEGQAPPARARGVGASEDASPSPHGPPPIIEWCARNLLTRIHRLTLERLRRQIEPATASQFVQFLLRWHHLEPGTQLAGSDAVAAVIERLQGFEIPAVAWESAILPGRIRTYDPAWLDELCLNGEAAWGRLSPPSVDSDDPKSRVRAATRTLPVSLWIREDFPWLRWRQSDLPDAVLSSSARTVFEVLRMRGATFFPDLFAEAHLLPTQVEEALWELVAAGRVTGDGFASIRSLANPMKRQQEAKIRRLRSRGRAVHAVRRGAGRWTLMPRPAETMKDEAILEAWSHQLLLRYGILFRDLLAREDGAPPWNLLRPVLRRMEARGIVHGGRFVLNVSGEQYALPEAVESLRHIRREPPDPEPVFVSAVDPLNLAGILTPGPRVTSNASNLVAFYAGNIVGYSKGGEVWVEELLPSEVKMKIQRTLETGKVL
jgi:ATP-dependent Lhr-like helicase